MGLLVPVYWAALTLAALGAGGALIFQALRPMPFGQPGLGIQQVERALLAPIGGPGFGHRWTVLDRAVIAAWGYVLVTVGYAALRVLAWTLPV